MSPATPLEDDDLLSEILLRLPPQPSSLPRACAVSRRWRSLASDPRFSARFRAHHRRNPPFLGCFVQEIRHIHVQPALMEGTLQPTLMEGPLPTLMEGHFQPALEAPNRVPEGSFTFPIAPIIQAGPTAPAEYFMILGCRHGLVLIFHTSMNRLQVCGRQLLVWDPVTGDQHRLDIPLVFLRAVGYPFSATALRAAGEDVHHFQVVLVGSCGRQQARAVAFVYSSKTGAWGNLVSAPLPSHDSVATTVCVGTPAVMVGNSLYWLFKGSSTGILEFDLASWSLALIPVPGEKANYASHFIDFCVTPAEGGGLGFFFLSEFSAQLWKRKTNCDGVASWVLGRTIALDKLLSTNSDKVTDRPFIFGVAEDNNTVLLKSSNSIFTVHLESLESKKIFVSNGCILNFCPFEGVYTADSRHGH